MAMGDAMLRSASQQDILANFKLSVRASDWSLTCNASVDTAYFTWDSLKGQMLCVFALPNQAYRVRLRFLAFHQERKEVSSNVQKLRTLLAAMQLDPLL